MVNDTLQKEMETKYNEFIQDFFCNNHFNDYDNLGMILIMSKRRQMSITKQSELF